MFELSLLGIVGLILTVWAILKIAGSDASNGGKALWICLILLLPVLGFIIWLLFGPR